MNIAVIGSGGREHSICYKISKSPKIKKLICIPGNAGTKKIAENIEIDILNFKEICKTLKKNKIDFVIVGPEVPLVAGIIDYLDKENIQAFGPDKFASKLEGSKAFMKELCKKNNIPTAQYEVFDDFEKAKKFIMQNKFPLVIKADGLAAGKGVTICENNETALKEAKAILGGKFKSSKKLIVEEFLQGEEASYFVIVDKNTYKSFGTAQDHKRVGEGDTGPNTGGMGAFSPAIIIDNELEKKIKSKIIEPTLNAMRKLGHPYKGILYAGLIINQGEPSLIEYNVRLGDPECQVLMMRLENDLLDLVQSTVNNNLEKKDIEWNKKKSMTVVMCSKGYPGRYKKDIEIKNLENISNDKENHVFHAGTYEKNGKIYSNGGRVLNVTSMSDNLINARDKLLQNIKKIDWPDSFYRKDIGWKFIK